ncbi:acetyltransferase [Flavobacterium sp. IR1]|nr:acetyltransferase [Flavobacterium sp. IR1]
MLERYGFLGSLRIFWSLIYTKLFFSNARLIRLPFDIRNRKSIKIGKDFTSGFGCRIEAYPQKNNFDKILIFGKNVEINDYVHIAAGERITIGDNVLIASKVFISDINHGSYKQGKSDNPLSIPKERKLSTDPIIVKDNAWIGEGVCIMSGVTIGLGSIIGALSVVTKDIPDYSIAVGSPAKVIKQFDFEKNEWVSLN